MNEVIIFDESSDLTVDQTDSLDMMYEKFTLMTQEERNVAWELANKLMDALEAAEATLGAQITH